MPSQKTNLQRHMEYLQARRSGAEFCLDLLRKSDPETYEEKVKTFIANLSTSIQQNSSELGIIEQAEREAKEAKKAQEAADKLRRSQGY